MNRTWTDEQEQYLVAHYATTSNVELAALTMASSFNCVISPLNSLILIIYEKNIEKFE